MSSKSRMVVVMLSLVLIFSLFAAACSNKNDNEASPSATPSVTGGASSPAASETNSEPPKLEPVTLTMNTTVPTLNWTNPIAVELQKRTGVTMKWDVITGDKNEKLNVWLAGGDYPDLISAAPNMTTNYGEANALVDLAELIPQYAPNILEAYGGNLDLLKDQNGKVWGVAPPPVTGGRDSSVGNWAIQNQVLKEAGYPVIKTADDAFNVVSAYLKNHPKNKDGKKNYGFSSMAEGGLFYNVFVTIADSYIGLPGGSVWFMADADNNLAFRWRQPDYTASFKFLNKLYLNDMLDEESLIQSEEQFNAKCNQGRVLMTIGPAWANSSCMIKDDPNTTLARFDVVLDGHEKLANFSKWGRGNWISITKNAKDPVRALQFIDQLYSLENRVLLGWGIEGQYYTMKDGKRVVTDWLVDQFDQSPDAFENLGLSYVNEFALASPTEFLEDGDVSRFIGSLSWENAQLKDYDKELLSHYNASSWSDLNVPAKQVSLPISSITLPDEIAKYCQEAKAQYEKVVKEIILAKDPSKIDGLWADFIKWLDKDAPAYEKQMSDSYKAYLQSHPQ